MSRTILMPESAGERLPPCARSAFSMAGDNGPIADSDHAAARACAVVGAIVDELYALAGAPYVPGGPAPRGVIHMRPTARRASVHRRQITMYLGHTMLGLPLTTIGAVLGRDRTTVSHACHMVEDRRDDAAYEHFIAAAERIVSAVFARGGGHGRTQ